MTTATRSIIRSSLRKSADKLNVVIFNTAGNESYNYLLSKTGHNFYIWTEQYERGWDTNPLQKPSNVHHLFNQDQFDQRLDFDLVICHNRFSQFDIGKSLSFGWHVPLIQVHHDDPRSLLMNDDGQPMQIDPGKMQDLYSRSGDINVFDNEEIMESWQSLGHVINPGIDREVFMPTTSFEDRENIVLYSHKEHPQNIQKLFQVLGDITQLIPIQRSSDEVELAKQFNKARAFISLNPYYLNIEILQAMACGNVVFSPYTPHLVNSKILPEQNMFQDVGQLRQLYQQVKTPTLLDESYSLNNFNNGWNSIFEQLENYVFTR